MTAVAQWQWVDKDGGKVFSDRAPPADIEEKNILKRQLSTARAPARATPASGPASAATGEARATAPGPGGQDARLQARKEQIDDEALAQRKGLEESAARVKADNCDRAKRGLASLESGVRITTTNAKGERELMDERARHAEAKRLKAYLAADCA